MAFLVELWESIFTPGTTPALLKATHVSFVLLHLSLISLIYLTRSIHFINLLVIALLLHGAVIWFVNELKQAKLKDNTELAAETEKVAEGEKTESGEKDNKVASTSATQKSTQAKKRKV